MELGHGNDDEQHKESFLHLLEIWLTWSATIGGRIKLFGQMLRIFLDAAMQFA